ncbi:MAG: hypothetical protein II433_10045 [Acidaminococcaceae bacterium]|nr:hypothetical protein [Acidaminococcaceae bacterium]
MDFDERIANAEHIVAWDNYFEDKQLGHFNSYVEFRNRYPSAEITCVQELEPNVFYVYC